MVRKRAEKPTENKHEPPSRGAWHGWPILPAVLLVGLVLRVAYLSELADKPDFDAPLADAAYNDYWARGLVTGEWSPPEHEPDPKIPSTPYFRPPGYPLFLAGVYGLTGSSYFSPRIIQIGLGLANCVLTFLLGRALFGRGVGWLGAALMSVYWTLIYFEGELQPPVLLVFLTLLLMHVLRLWVDRQTHLRTVGLGLLIGLLALVRANVLVFVPVLLAWAWWVGRRRKDGRRFGWTSAGFLTGMILIIAPVTVRNYVVGRDFVLISSNGGINLYIGNNPRTSLVTPRIPDVERIAGRSGWNLFAYREIVRGVERQEQKALTDSQVSRYFAGRAFEFILEHPAAALGYAVKRALLFWGPQEVSNNKVLAYERKQSRTLRFLPGFPAAMSGSFVGLAFLLLDQRKAKIPEARLRSGPKTCWEIPVVILLFVAVYSCSFLPFLVAGRFRLPIVPFLLLLTAYGLYRTGRLAGTRQFRRLAGCAVVWVGSYFLTSRPIVPYEPDEASWHLDRGAAYQRKGRLDRAVEEYRAAVQADPDSPDAHALLGSALAGLGKLSEAETHYRGAIEISPSFAEARRKLGNLLGEVGRTDEAIQAYRAALRVSPNNTEALYNLGRALGQRGSFAEAIAALRQALDNDPTYTPARVNLGVMLVKAGRIDEAIREYRRAIQLDVGAADAHYNLGRALNARGSPDQALAEYRAALRIDPDYVEARINLGVLLRNQRHLEQATHEFRQAIRTDPQRFEAWYNLAEVLAAQGRTDQAIRELEIALRIRPDHPAALRALRALRAQQANAPGP